LRWFGNYECIQNVGLYEEKMRENTLRWFGYVQWRPVNAPARKGD
jgi:hypothetical protein